MFNLKKFLLTLIAVLTFYGVEARGESFMLTDVQGSAYVITYEALGPPILMRRLYFGISGPGLGIVSSDPPGGGGDFGNVEARDACIIAACRPGMVIGTNSSYFGLIAPSQGAHARVNGVFYSMVQLTGQLAFVSSPILIEDTGVWFKATIPFTLLGDLTGNAVGPDIVNPIFTASLSGHGYVIFHFLDVTYGTEEIPMYKLHFAEYHFGPFPISIDVKPATFPNSINPKSRGRIPVAILTTNTFNATDVDPATMLFGANGSEVGPVHFASEDVDGDGDIDLVLHFVTQETGITCGNDSASLTGATFSGMAIKGSDSIETAPCN
jgi:hypothetical protein